jgi:hypothetical protein
MHAFGKTEMPRPCYLPRKRLANPIRESSQLAEPVVKKNLHVPVLVVLFWYYVGVRDGSSGRLGSA